MALDESDSRAKRIDPALHARGWTEDLIRREETAGAVEIVAGRPRRRGHGRVDYTLRVKVTPTSQPVAVALIEAKAEDLPPAHGLEQGKAYAAAARLVEEAPTLETFRGRWIAPAERREMLGRLPDAGRSAILVRTLEQMTDYDLYDVLAELGYGLAPRTRVRRADAFTYKHRG
jgi:hypothetical protein